MRIKQVKKLLKELERGPKPITSFKSKSIANILAIALNEKLIKVEDGMIYLVK